MSLPDSDQKHASGKETRLKRTNQRSNHHNHTPMLRKRTAQYTNSPGKTQKAQPARSTHFANNKVGRDLQDEVGDEEDEERNGVTFSLVDAEIFFHSGDACDGEIGSVDAVDCVHQAQDGDEAEVDLPSA